MTKAQNMIFCQVLKDAGLPAPVREFRFHPTRKWRFDYAFVSWKLFIEFEGGAFLRTEDGRSKGHANPVRFLKDMEKYNQATLLGWRSLRFTPRESCLTRTIETIKQALGM